MYTVYKIYNTIENKCYIGCTSDYERRIQDHLSEGKFSSISHLFATLPKSSFIFSVLHTNIETKELAEAIETEEIVKHDSVDNGYNNIRYFGEQSTKLSKDQVVAIYHDYRPNNIIAKDYNVSHTTVNNIKLKKTRLEVTKYFTDICVGQPAGEKHHKARLTEKQVIDIWFDSRQNIDIAIQYDVNRHTIRDIKTRTTWTHITKDLVSTYVGRQFRVT